MKLHHHNIHLRNIPGQFLRASSITDVRELAWTRWNNQKPIEKVEAEVCKVLQEKGLVAAAGVLMRKYAMQVELAHEILCRSLRQCRIAIGSFEARDALHVAYYTLTHIPLGSGNLAHYSDDYVKAAKAGSLREWRMRVYEFLMSYEITRTVNGYRVGSEDLEPEEFGDFILSLHPYAGQDVSVERWYYWNIMERIDQILSGDRPAFKDLLNEDDLITASEQRIFFPLPKGKRPMGRKISPAYPTSFQ